MNIYITPYNLCRTLLALNTLISLLFNSNYVLFGKNISTNVFFEEYGLFFLLSGNLIAAKLLAVIIMIIVISGFYPKWTCIPHFYISYSFIMACDVNFGADRIASNITLLLIPLCFLDKRKNHFYKNNLSMDILLNSRRYWFFYMALMLQIFLIYFQAFHKKILLNDWRNGTAVFYYITHNEFGLGIFPYVESILLNNVYVIYILTYGALFIELILSLFIFIKHRVQLKFNYRLLFFGIFFHLILMFVHGLAPFLLVMSGVLCFYILPFDYVKKIHLSI